MLAALCALGSQDAPAQERAEVSERPADEQKTLFILLIDVSYTTQVMNSRWNVTEQAVPELVFEGGPPGVVPPVPTFNPNRGDRLAVVFFSLTESTFPDGCRPDTGWRFSFETLFVWRALPDPRPTETELGGYLGEWLEESCLSEAGNRTLSPKSTAEWLAPIFVASHLDTPDGVNDLFDRTVMIVGSNDNFNVEGARELQYFGDYLGVEDADWANVRVGRMQDHFRRVAPAEWRFTADLQGEDYSRLLEGSGPVPGIPNPLRLSVAELDPLGVDPRSLVEFRREHRLDRAAVSNDHVELIDADGAEILIRIRENPRYEPLAIDLAFSAPDGDRWTIGSAAAPARLRIDLDRCGTQREPACSRTGGGLVIDILKAAGVADDGIAPEGFRLEEGRLSFSVTFQFIADIAFGQSFNLMRVRTEPETIDFTPVPVQTVETTLLGWVADWFDRLWGSTPPPADVRLDAAMLAELWRDGDGRLTQELAAQRLLAGQETREFEALVLGGGILAGGVLLVFLACLLLFYHRPFKPHLVWEPADGLRLDFGQPGRSRLLAGRLKIDNRAGVPWFGWLLRNKEQPRRKGALALQAPNLERFGLRLATVGNPHPVGPALGFLPSDTVSERLAIDIQPIVAHEYEYHLFLATEAIADFDCPDRRDPPDPPDPPDPNREPADEATIALTLQARLTWRRKRLHRDMRRPAVRDFNLPLTLKREPAALPAIRYVAADMTAIFDYGESLEVGRFVFESRTRTRFSQPFERRYSLLARRSDAAMLEGGLRLAREVIRLDHETRRLEVPVLLDCDGEHVRNPDASSDTYTIRLVGEATPDSALGPHLVEVRRDVRGPQVKLIVRHRRRQFDIWWPVAGDPMARPYAEPGAETGTGHGADAGADQILSGGRLAFEEPRSIRFKPGDGPKELVRVVVGNTGKAGGGNVRMKWRAELKFADAYEAEEIRLRDDRPLEDMIVFNDELTGAPIPKAFDIPDRADDSAAVFRIDCSRIERLDNARLKTAAADIHLAFTVDDGRDHVFEREVALTVPFTLEELAPPNWLCIDFGTSAIVAALGRGDDVIVLPLQSIDESDEEQVQGERNFGKFDNANLELGNPFLPSYLICNADLRQDRKSAHARPGFPSFAPASLRPGEPSFIGLPATTTQMRELPGRIISSLKSWLGRSAHTVPLPTAVKFEDAEGRVVTDGFIPLDDIMVSTFAALANAYLSDSRHQAGKLVVTCPNTFTPLHRERLKRCVYKAVRQPPLNIRLEDRIELISESDAVAFHYLRRRAREEMPRGEERVLVYDFGAGTLDLTLTKVTWHHGDAVYPEGWQVEGRLGLPVAGNHLDTLLARLIDRLLREQSCVDPDKFTYRYPIVAHAPRGDEADLSNYRIAASDLAVAIKRAKQGDPGRGLPSWDGSAPFMVEVGAQGDPAKVLQIKAAAAFSNLPEDPPHYVPGLFRRDSSVYLAIPASHVHDDPAVQAFIGFVTEEVVQEVLATAGRKSQDVDALVVSGRGALWPGLRERVFRQFPQVDPLRGADATAADLKEAVVRGAIAWQRLRDRLRGGEERPPRLAVLLEDENRLVTEEHWDRPIDLSATESFRLVQCETANPEPERDLKSLRRHFYIDLGDRNYYRAEHWDVGSSLLTVRREQDRNGYTTIRLENADGYGEIIGVKGQAASFEARPPWPIGRLTLEPERKPESKPKPESNPESS